MLPEMKEVNRGCTEVIAESKSSSKLNEISQRAKSTALNSCWVCETKEVMKGLIKQVTRRVPLRNGKSKRRESQQRRYFERAEAHTETGLRQTRKRRPTRSFFEANRTL